MYSGPHRYGRGASSRGGAGGGSKRNSFPPPPPPHRNPTSTSHRLSLGGSSSHSRTPSSATPPPSQSADERFRLVGGESPSFAALIKLAPDLVDEIKRVEAQGGAAQIKFDANPSNPGNVIDVGGKEFRFTWSHEMGSCDIYEERQSGEDGNGLLVESGFTWRKLNIQRVLDDSVKDQVKRRSQEYEQSLKSRKAIVLEPGNPSMKSQMKALAAAEASPWKHKQKKDFNFKKRNIEPPQGPLKPVHKSALSSTTTTKRRRSSSPLTPPPNQSIPLASPSTRGNAAESQFTAENPTSTQERAKENASISEKDFSTLASGRMQGASVRRDIQGGGGLDLQNSLIMLLKDNPKGLSLKALEKAVGDSARKIEPIVKKIATYGHPGRYILKPGMEVENLKSSPEGNLQKQFAPEDSHGAPALDSGYAEKSPAKYMEEQVPSRNQLDRETNLVENLDPSQQFVDLFGDDEPPDDNERQAASSSGSDSDSGTSNSGTDSASRSRSRSPARSASAGSSGSDGDSSSNSKEGSDVDVNITSDDETEPKKLLATEHVLSTSPAIWSMPEAGPAQDGNARDQDGYTSEDIDIENDFVGHNEAQLTTAPHDVALSTENLRKVSPDQNQHQPYGVTRDVDDRGDGDEFKHERRSSFLNIEGEPKRGPNVNQSEEDADTLNRFKGRAEPQSSISGHLGSSPLGSPPKFPPDLGHQGNHDNYKSQMSNRFNRNDHANGKLGMERAYDYPLPGKSATEPLKSSRRPPARTHIFEPEERPVQNSLNMGIDIDYRETDACARESYLKQGEKVSLEAQDEEGSSNERGNGIVKESSFTQKSHLRPELLQKNQSEGSKKSHASDTTSRWHSGSSPKDGGRSGLNRSPVDKRSLHRELSDLELGELREPLPEESKLAKKSFERVCSFKRSETRLGTSSSRNSDLKGKPANQLTAETVNTSSPSSRRDSGKTDSLSKRKLPEPDVEDAILPERGVQSQQQSMGSRAEMGSLSNKAVDPNRLEHDDTVANQGLDLEGYGETQRKSYSNAHREDSRKPVGSHKSKSNKSRKSNAQGDSGDKRKDLVESRKDKRKRNESSSEENTPFLKYEKEEPKFREPIKNFPQFKEYVQEYREKYESYCSLNKILENYRRDFQKLGMDLDSAKGRDSERYHSIVAQLRENFRQCGTRHKRLKKIFLMLHEELQHLKQRIKDFAADYRRD